MNQEECILIIKDLGIHIIYIYIYMYVCVYTYRSVVNAKGSNN